MVSGVGQWVLDETDLPIHANRLSRVRAWAPSIPGIAEVFHARIVDWGYPRHCHDTWAVLLVDQGTIHYDLDGRRHEATASSVSVIPPGIVHDGRPAPGTAGFRKREIYLDETFLPNDFVGAAVDRTNLVDVPLAALLNGIHESLTAGEHSLDAETRLAAIGQRLQDRLARHTITSASTDTTVAPRLRELLDAHLANPPTLAHAAEQLDRSSAHLARSFTRTYGVSPHAYVIGRRIDIARRRLLRGDRPADIATDLGFYDQAHFNRHFRRHTSTTPGRYASGA
jgi:AraC-like DNA-binding protein